MACLYDAAFSLMLSFVTFGIAHRPAYNSDKVDLEETRETKQGKIRNPRETTAELEAPYISDLDFWQQWKHDEKQKWAAFKRVNDDQARLRYLDDQMRDLQDKMRILSKNVIETVEMLGMENKLGAETIAGGNAEQDVVGSWHFKNRSRSATFSIHKKGTQMLLTQNRDGRTLEAPLNLTGEWWQGQGDVSIFGGGSEDTIRIRRRGNKLICNTKGPDEWQWRGTIVAVKEGDNLALCDDIFESDSKVNLAAVKRCLDSTGFLYIQLPKGEHTIDEPFVFKSYGTLLLQGDADKAATLRCSRAHAAFEFSDGAELLLEGLIVDSCGANGSGAVLADDKDNVSLRLQRGSSIRNAIGHGVCMKGRNSNVLLEDNSTICNSGVHGIFAEGGENNSFLLRNSGITGSAKTGLFAQGGKQNAFMLDGSMITGSGNDGLSASGGEKHSFSLGYSTITGSGSDGLYVYEGKGHCFSLVYSNITGSGTHGIEVEEGGTHSLSLSHSTITGSRHDGLVVYGGTKHGLSLGHSAITASGEIGLRVNGGDEHSFSLGYSTISGSGNDGLRANEGKKYSFSVGYSNITDNANHGINVLEGEKHSFSLGYSTITGSRKDNFQVFSGKEHTLSLGYCMITGSGENGLYTHEGEGHSLSLGYSTITGSARNGVWSWQGKGHSFNLGHSTITGSGRDGLLATKNGEGSSFSLGHCNITDSEGRGLAVSGGEKNSFSLGYSTITRSKHDGIALAGGKEHTLSLGYSTITGSRDDGLAALRGEKHSFSVGYSTITGSGGNGLLLSDGKEHTLSLGYCTITGSGSDGLALKDRMKSRGRFAPASRSTRSDGLACDVSVGYSNITGSGENGLRVRGGTAHSLRLGYSMFEGSGRSGLFASRGWKHSFSLQYSTITGSARNGLLASGGGNHTFSIGHSAIIGSEYNGFEMDEGENHTFSLGYSTIKNTGNDCFNAGGSIHIWGCTFEGCGGTAVRTSGKDDGELRIMNTKAQNAREGLLSLRPDAKVTMKNVIFWNIASDAVTALTGSLFTENVSVHTSGAAFQLGDIAWIGSRTTIMGNGHGITCSGATRGTLTSAFVFLNGVYDIHNCARLALDVPLPMKVHADMLWAYVIRALELAMALTAILPIIQDPPREFCECSWLLIGLSVAAAATWLATSAAVLSTAYVLFQRPERDEDKYGVDARGWGIHFIFILITSMIATIVVDIIAFLARKKYTFLLSTAQSLLDSEKGRKRQQDLAQQRSQYTEKLQAYQVAMVKDVTCATTCTSAAEGQHYLKSAQDQFEQMQKLTRDTGKDLDSKLHRDAQQMYKDDPLRWQTLLDVESITQKPRYQGEHMTPFSRIIDDHLMQITEEETNEEVTRRLLLAASWGRSVFQESLENVAIRLNESEHVNDLIYELSDDFPSVAEKLDTIIHEVRNLKSRRYKLLGDLNATICGEHCNVLMGPNKTYESASRKAATLHEEHKAEPPKDAAEWQKPAARYLYDVLRATVVFSDPVALVVYFNLLATEFTIISTKNKYKEPLEKVGSPSILVNIEVNTILGKLNAEVQLYLDKFLDLKHLAHTNYEVDRVRDLSELLSPFHS